MKKKIWLCRKTYENWVDIKKIMKTWNLRDMSAEFDCKILGYNNPEEYYYESSTYVELKNLNDFPLFIMSSRDDPLVTPLVIPMNIVKQSKNKIVMLTDKGGHASYICGYTKLWLWFPKPVLEFINYFDC